MAHLASVWCDDCFRGFWVTSFAVPPNALPPAPAGWAAAKHAVVIRLMVGAPIAGAKCGMGPSSERVATRTQAPLRTHYAFAMPGGHHKLHDT